MESTQTVKDQAAKIIEEVQALVNKPLSFEMNGHISIQEVDGGITIRLTKAFTAYENEPMISELSAPTTVVRRTRRARGTAIVGRKHILNSANVPGFTAFILKNGMRTKRANVVMTAYRHESEGVPGREIISWAKENPNYASEVMVEVNKESIPLNDFVKNFN